MIKLNIASLKAFQALTSSMKENTMLPILTNLRLEPDTLMISKNNLQAVCEARMAGSSVAGIPPILLDQQVLFGFINNSSAEEVEISVTEKQIRITDTVTEIFLPREDENNFPKTPVIPEEAEVFVFNRDHIFAIKIARSFLNESESGGNFQFVHIVGGKYIAGFHTHYFYLNTRYADLPPVLLNAEQADVITSADTELKFAASGNHYFFTSPVMRYVFTRQEGQPLKLETIEDRLKLPGKNFTIMKNDIVSFCNNANMISKSPISNCIIANLRPGVAQLRLSDSNYERSGMREVTATGTFDDFSFNARIIAQPLRNIPYDILECKTNQNTLIITGSEEYFSFIGMQKQ